MGKSWLFLGSRRKDGRPHLLLAPPNTDPVLIPADWTDFGNREDSPRPGNGSVCLPSHSGPLGSIADLIRLRSVIDGLLRCPSGTGADNQQPLGTEGTGATVPELPDPAATRNAARAARTGATRRTCPGPDHHQGGRSRR